MKMIMKVLLNALVFLPPIRVTKCMDVSFSLLYAKKLEKQPNFGWSDTVKCQEVTNLFPTLESKMSWQLWVIRLFPIRNKVPNPFPPFY